MYCQHCQIEWKSDDKYCQFCGKSLQPDSSSASQEYTGSPHQTYTAIPNEMPPIGYNTIDIQQFHNLIPNTREIGNPDLWRTISNSDAMLIIVTLSMLVMFGLCSLVYGLFTVLSNIF